MARGDINEYYDPRHERQMAQMLKDSREMLKQGHLGGIASVMTRLGRRKKKALDEEKRSAASAASARGLSNKLKTIPGQAAVPGVTEEEAVVGVPGDTGAVEGAYAIDPIAQVDARIDPTSGPLAGKQRELAELLKKQPNNIYAQHALNTVSNQIAARDYQTQVARTARSNELMDAERKRQADKDYYLFQQQNKVFPPSKPSGQFNSYMRELQRGNTNLSFSDWSVQFALARGGVRPNFFKPPTQTPTQPPTQTHIQPAPKPLSKEREGVREPIDPGPFVLSKNIIPGTPAAHAAAATHDRLVAAYDRRMRALEPGTLQYKKYTESIDVIDASDESLASIEYALGLSGQSFDGITAAERAYLVKNFMPKGWAPQLYAESVNTGLMTKAITEKALGALKATFGGMPTEGERKILLEIQGSPDLPQPERDALWKRAKELVLLRRKREMRKIKIFERNHPKKFSMGYSGKKVHGSDKSPVPSTSGTPNAVLKFDANGRLIK